ncbi:hypothetical protein CBOM_07498 [Ceraceosorus bombacis]|uniref:Uncharacterized protein n=1 Tax=Ceraceosorus bombacis TaxID=401625 RepID=A0A0P1BCY5_9BASI|nr:hypothetical protein CBOM_07498 [Ceraceosorus bombacis]
MSFFGTHTASTEVQLRSCSSSLLERIVCAVHGSNTYLLPFIATSLAWLLFAATAREDAAF